MKNILVMVGICFLVVMGYYALRGYYLKPRLIQGQKAIEIVDKLPDGSRFSLLELKGQYVLLDFWGSWCGPCIESHPALVQLYKRFHGQTFTDATDFEIVSIALESNDRNWQYIILEDQLYWPYHLLGSEMFDSPIAKAYNVKQLPTKFLINPQGLILAVDPSMSQIINMLQSRLKSEADERVN